MLPCNVIQEYKKICRELSIKRPSKKQVELIDALFKERQRNENEREYRQQIEYNLTKTNQEIGELRSQKVSQNFRIIRQTAV